MKKFLFLLPVLAFFSARSQQHACAAHKQQHFEKLMQHQARTAGLLPQISHELKYDVKFVHLDLNLERNTKYVSGNVKTVATVLAAPLDTFQTLLHQNFTVDSVKINGVILASTRKDSLIKVKPQSPIASGSSFTVVLWYKGTAPTGGAAIGSGYSTGTSGAWGNQVSWSLSEAVVAYHWWPCKQILTDKIDSSWVFVTTDSTNKVGSNGLLTNVLTTGSKKRYEWKSRYPIAYYLISVAIAKYKEYRQYAKPAYLANDSILIQNYIYDNAINNNAWISTQKVQLDKMPQVLGFMSDMFGMYPFYREKYGHSMAPFSGGMEHQTMTSLGFFDYYLDAHELGHQWWGDQVTCKSWGDIWINEGFAVYSEFLTSQYLDPANFASEVNSAHTSVMSQPGGSIFFTDTLNSSRIFSSRLTYNKGGSILHTLRFVTNNDSLWFNALRGFQNAFKFSTASAADFKTFYESATGINATQFFNQWYYGQGYPTFDVKYKQSGNVCYIQSTQSTSTPSSVPLFITPIEYKITRNGAADTTVRVMHSNTTENYTFAITGTVTGLLCDPNNWIINKVIGPSLDPAIGIEELPEEMQGISVGPNPTRGSLIIQNPSGLKLKLTVMDAMGKPVEESEGGHVDLSQQPTGVYLLKVNCEKGEKVFRVMKD